MFEEIKKFLDCFEWYCIYCADFSGKITGKKTIKIIEELNEYNLVDIIWYNNWETPNDRLWVYFTPNWNYRKSNCVRKKNKATLINCFCVDIDRKDHWNKTKKEIYEEVIKHIVEPSIIVETKNWYHLYWLLKNKVDVDKEKLEIYSEVEDYLVKITWWDEKAKDIARVLRVPWFRYWKDGEWKFKIKIIKFKPDLKYSFNFFKNIVKEYKDSLNYVDDLLYKHILSGVVGNKQQADRERFFEKINDLCVKDVLEELYPQYKVMDNWSIRDWGELTSWYKWNKNENYLNCFSPHDERPRWKPYNIVKKYFDGDIKKIVERAEKHWIYLEHKNEYRITSDYVLQADEIWEWKGKIHYIVKKLLLWEEISKDDETFEVTIHDTTFIFNLWNDTISVLNNGKKTWWINVYMSWGIVLPLWYAKDLWYVVLIKKKNKIKKTVLRRTDMTLGLRTDLKKFWISLTNQDKWYTWLVSMIYNYWMYEFDVVSSMGVNIINWEKIFITKDMDWYVDINKKVYVDIKKISDMPLRLHDRNWKYEVKTLWDVNTVVKILKSIYEWDVILPLFLWMFLGNQVAYFRNKKDPVRITFIWWQKESWKTTLLRVMFELFWYTNWFSASTTELPKTKLFTFLWNVWLSEYRYNKIEWKNFEKRIRELYDWMWEQKWQTSLETITYPHNAKLYIDWQSKYEDWAAKSRTLFLTAMNRKKKPDWLRAMKELEKFSMFEFSVNKPFNYEEFRNIAHDKINYIKKYIENIWLPVTDRWLNIYAELFATMEYLELKENDVLRETIKFDMKYKEGNELLKAYNQIFVKSGMRFSNIKFTLWRWWIIIDIQDNILSDDLMWIIEDISIEKDIYLERMPWQILLPYDTLCSNMKLFFQFYRYVLASRANASLEIMIVDDNVVHWLEKIKEAFKKFLEWKVEDDFWIVFEPLDQAIQWGWIFWEPIK